MPITQATKDLLITAFTEIDDIEFVALAELIYDSILPANNKASGEELSTLGKQIFAQIPFKALNSKLKIPLMRSAAFFGGKLPLVFKVKAIEAAVVTPETAPPAPPAAPSAPEVKPSANGETPQTET